MASTAFEGLHPERLTSRPCCLRLPLSPGLFQTIAMGRFSRVKGGCGKKCEAPELEAHFTDGAWYDIVLRAADPSRNRFLVQVRLLSLPIFPCQFWIFLCFVGCADLHFWSISCTGMTGIQTVGVCVIHTSASTTHLPSVTWL